MKRLFAALKIQPDPGFLHTFQSLKKSLCHENIKWVETPNIHITLKFFGETPEKSIPEISRVLKMTASQHRYFDISLQGLGIFGSEYSPRVIWVGIEPYRELSDLMKSLQANFILAGFVADRQNPVPHLTLGRIKRLADKILFKNVLERHKEICSLPMHLDKVTLFESIFRREGPEYIALDHFHFKVTRPSALE